MKVSSREKYLLVILGSVLTCILYYQFIFSNQYAKVTELQKQKSELKSKYETTVAFVNSLDKKKEDLKSLNSKIYSKTLVLYPSIIQEKIILELDDLLRKSNVLGNLAFSNIEIKQIEDMKKEDKIAGESSLQQYVDDYNSKESSKNDAPATPEASNNTAADNSLTVQQMKVTVAYTGTYKDLTAFIKNVEDHNLNKRIVINNLTIESTDDGKIKGTFEMELYSIPKFDDSDDYAKYTLSGALGKENPFDGVTPAKTSLGTDGSKVSSVKSGVASNYYDFLLLVRPSASDLATVSLNYGKDTKMETAVYADGDGVENVEIYVSKENGKYYYKYKTSRESYPKNYDSDKIEFVPQGDLIVLKAISTIRLDQYDKSGVNVKLFNYTDKTFRVEVYGDDTVRPRVSFANSDSNINITKNK